MGEVIRRADHEGHAGQERKVEPAEATLVQDTELAGERARKHRLIHPVASLERAHQEAPEHRPEQPQLRRVGRAPAPAELRLLGSMLGSLLVRSFERGDRMYQAMLSRAFAGEFRVLDQRRFGWLDLAFLAGVALVIGAAYHFAHRP